MTAIVPLPGAMESIHSGIVSTMHRANSAAKNAVAPAPVGLDPDLLELLVDPQTSGGLLIGVAADKSAALCADLETAGYQHAAVIGEVISRDVADSDRLFLR
jgi:selenide,water dikinase